MGQKLLVQDAPGGPGSRLETGSEAGSSGELHHFLHQYNQQSHSPGQGLQSGLPLPLSPQSQQAAIAGVKREPEDLSSSRAAQQPAKRHKQSQQPDSPTPSGMYHHHQHQLQVSLPHVPLLFPSLRRTMPSESDCQTCSPKSHQ